MKLCLVGINASYTHTSLSCRCLKKATGDVADVYEFTLNDSPERIIKKLYSASADVYGFSCYIWNIEFILKIAESLKCIIPHIKIVLGGPEVSYDAKSVLENNEFVDFILCGEGEESIKAFADGEPFENISGLVWRGEEEIKENKIKVIENLDLLPRLYTLSELKELDKKIIYYETSRGCPYNCSFCLSSVSRGVRFFSLDRVFEDFKLFSDCGVRLVKLVDRTFNISEERTNKIIEFILNNTKETSFHFEISAHTLKESTIKLLKSSPKGKIQLEIGVQSTNVKTLELINRTPDLKALKENVISLKGNGNMHIHLDLIAGLPYENLNSFKNSFNEVFALRPDMLQLGFLKLLKGTKIRDEKEMHNYKFLPYPPYEIISNDYISYKDILKLKEIEDVLEKYYNSGAFKNSVEYMIKVRSDAFEFFSDLADYFKKRGYADLLKSRRELYDIFYEYNKKDEKFASILLFDCLKYNKGVPLPYWAKFYGKDFTKRVSEYLSENRNVLPENLQNEKLVDILKNVRVYPFEYNVLGGLEKENCVVLFDYFNQKEIRL